MISFPSTIGLNFRWNYPSPPAVKYQLTQMEGYFENAEVFMETAKEEAQLSMARRFVTETDPGGDLWPSLVNESPFQQGILQLTGLMRDESLDDQAWKVTPVGVFFDTSKIPDYWVYHEQPRYDENNPRSSVERIPQRRFIGLDDEAAQRIEYQFDNWVAGGLYMNRRFVRQRQNALGQFESF